MSGNKNMAHYANFESHSTKIRVHQEPGGTSSFSLGWSKPSKAENVRQSYQQPQQYSYNNPITPTQINSRNMHQNSSTQDYGNSLQLRSYELENNQLTGAERRHAIVEMNREKDAHERRYHDLIERSAQHHYDTVNSSPVKSFKTPLEVGYMRYKTKVEDDVSLKYLKNQQQDNDDQQYSSKDVLQTKYKENRFNNLMSDFPSSNRNNNNNNNTNPYGNMYDNLRTNNNNNNNYQDTQYATGYHAPNTANSQSSSQNSDMKTGKKIWQPPGGKTSFSFY